MYGQELKIESIAYVFEDIEFCQTKPCFLGDKWVMTPNPRKFVNSFFAGHSLPAGTALWRRHLLGVAQCNLAYGTHTPVIGEICMHVQDMVTEKPIFEYSRDLLYKVNKEISQLGRVQYVHITESDRRNLERAWGITPNEQITLVNQVTKIKFNREIVRVPPIVDVTGVNYALPNFERVDGL